MHDRLADKVEPTAEKWACKTAIIRTECEKVAFAFFQLGSLHSSGRSGN